MTERFGDPAVDARLAAMLDRVTELRRRAGELVERAGTVTAEVRQTREQAQRLGCPHRDEALAMRGAIDSLSLELDGLRTAMATRAVIEQAKGMMMMHRHCDDDEAFRVLVDLSQTSHRKLVDVAGAVVRSWSTPEHSHA